MSEKKLPFSEELVREIAAVYGTPFHLYDEKGISDNVKRLQPFPGVRIFMNISR